MSACSHTPKTVLDTRFTDERCENCRCPFKNQHIDAWLDGFNKFLTPSVSEVARARKLRLEAAVEAAREVPLDELANAS